jgi:hypothetical protein
VGSRASENLRLFVDAISQRIVADATGRVKLMSREVFVILSLAMGRDLHNEEGNCGQ